MQENLSPKEKKKKEKKKRKKKKREHIHPLSFISLCYLLFIIMSLVF